MDGKEGKWKKEMEKRTLSTLLNKENEDENASSKNHHLLLLVDYVVFQIMSVQIHSHAVEMFVNV